MNDWEKEERNELAHLTEIYLDLQKAILKKETMLKLVKAQRLRLVKNLISRKVDYNIFWQYAKENYGNKRSKEHPIQDFLREKFEDDGIVFDTIQSGGWSGYYWCICFSKGDMKFELTVPTTEMKVEDLEFCADGKLSLAIDKDLTIEHIANSYDFEDILKAYKDKLSEKGD